MPEPALPSATQLAERETARWPNESADIRDEQDMGFMYSRSFEDLDGHVFEPLFMDLDAFMAAGDAAHEHA